MHIHILGIAGTFMGSLALIGKQLGHKITGMDDNIYPPMSTQLAEQNISYTQGYQPKDLPEADIFIIGNALTRGNACVEEILSQQYCHTSGAQWLGENVLRDKWVLAVSGTHGKTTTASMLAWILEYAGYNPSFLIGGVAQNFSTSSRLTDSNFFVLEADEYDSAFFDKRSKFLHYRPKTLVINNLEFDHSDIFDSLADIQTQFHHLIRTLPKETLIIYPQNNTSINQVLDKGVFSMTQTLPSSSLENSASGSAFNVEGNNRVNWSLLGEHNMQNGLSAIYAAHHAGVAIDVACKALATFKGVKRRLEIKYQRGAIILYDDFAHHPSAIKATLSGLRVKVGNAPIIAILELRSNAMKSGAHQQNLADSLKGADQVLVLRPANLNWNIDAIFNSNDLFDSVDAILEKISPVEKGHIVIMSNGEFGDIHNKLIGILQKRKNI